jgi:phosphoglycerate dehydrogenase-like enzyme
VNTSRGPIVDETALVVALRERWIGGAAIDVFDREPLTATHPFRGLDNLLATPHLGYVTEETYRVYFTDVVADIEAWLGGAPLRLLTTAR